MAMGFDAEMKETYVALDFDAEMKVTTGMVPEEDWDCTHGIKQNSNVVYVGLGECLGNTAGQYQCNDLAKTLLCIPICVGPTRLAI